MVYSARFEVYALDSPAHGPVDFPHKLNMMIVAHFNRFGFSAQLAAISKRFAVVRNRYNLGYVFAATRTINVYGRVFFAIFLAFVLGFVFH